MKNLILPLLLLLLSCSDGETENQSSNSDDLKNDFPNYTDSNNLRIFAREGVSSTFLKNVGIAYSEMLKENSKIDQSMKSKYLSISRDEFVYQRLGVDGMASDPNFDPGTPPKPYNDNATDYIWQLTSGGTDQIGEVIEHLLHTVTAVVLYLSYSDWDYKDESSPLSLAAREAIDKKIYDVSSYDNLRNDNVYEQIITQEYAYWLILAEWDYYSVTGKKEGGSTGNEEFTVGTPSEIQSLLPLGHKLYQDYIEKIFSIPDRNIMTELFY